MTFSRKQRVLLAVLPPLAAVLIRALCGTLRFYQEDEPGARPADLYPAEPGVYVFWHRALLLAAYRYRGLGIRILISASFDGELIARVVERLGFAPVRGSSSRGGAAGLLALTRARLAGHKTAITADGPRGPVYLAKPGASAVARRAGSTASCFYLHAEKSWLLHSWDRFVIPKPFSRVHVRWQAPLDPAACDSAGDAAANIQTSLDRAVEVAEAAALERLRGPSLK